MPAAGVVLGIAALVVALLVLSVLERRSRWVCFNGRRLRLVAADSAVLEDPKTGLVGKPDVILEDPGAKDPGAKRYIVVERKSRSCAGVVHEAEIMQLMAYLYLVTVSMGPCEGYIEYGNGHVHGPFELDEAAVRRLLEALRDIRRLRQDISPPGVLTGAAARRCRGCTLREECQIFGATVLSAT